jgi:hypothetical protein
MRVLMFGAGVIGTIYGNVLAQSRVDVTHYVRPGKKQSLEDGIRIQLLDGRTRSPKDEAVLYKLNVTDVLGCAEDRRSLARAYAALPVVERLHRASAPSCRACDARSAALVESQRRS